MVTKAISFISLSRDKQNEFILQNKAAISALRKKTGYSENQAASVVFTNQRFEEEFPNKIQDKEWADQFSINDRYRILDDAQVQAAFYKKAAPYDADWDSYTAEDLYFGSPEKFDNLKFNPDKGFGNEADFDKYNQMSIAGKRAFLNSGYLTPKELEEKGLSTIQKIGAALTSGAMGGLVGGLTAGGMTLFGLGITAPVSIVAGIVAGSAATISSKKAIEDHMLKKFNEEQNQKILTNIYNTDGKYIVASNKATIDTTYNNIVQSNISDEDINKRFLEIITRDTEKGILGNGLFKAYFGDGTTIDEEVSDFSIDQKRFYIAKYETLRELVGEARAQDILLDWSQSYIANHQDMSDFIEHLAQSISTTASAHVAGMVIDGKQAYAQFLDSFDGGVLVYKTINNEIVSEDNVEMVGNPEDPESVHFYRKDGNHEEVWPTKETRSSLNYAGKDFQGHDEELKYNQEYWNNVAKFNTYDVEEQKQYKQIGYSPYNYVFEQGDDLQIWFETGKMGGFIAADYGLNLVFRGINKFSKFLQTTKSLVSWMPYADKVIKTLNTAGNIGEKVGNFLQRIVHPVASSGSIGNSYAKTAYDEAVQENNYHLDEKFRKFATENIKKKTEDEDSNYKEEILKKAEQLANKEKTRRESNGEEVDAVTYNRFVYGYTQQLLNQDIDAEFEKLKNSPEYVEGLTEGNNTAARNAFTMFLTDATKYTINNLWGYRSWIFRSNSSMTKQAKKAVESGDSKFQRFTNTIRHPKKTYKAWKEGRLKNNYSNVGSDKEGHLIIMDKAYEKGHRAIQLGKKAAGQMWGGGWTNWTDEIQMGAAKAINEEDFNNYLNGTYSAQSKWDIVNAYYAAANYIDKAFDNALTESARNSFIIGALGSAVNPTIQVSNLLSLTTKSGRAQLKNMTRGEKVNFFITNGIFTNYYAERAAERDLQNTLDITNKLIDEMTSFTTLSNVMSAHKALDDFQNEIGERESSKTVEDFISMFEHMSTLEEIMQTSPLWNHSTKAMTALQYVQNLANGNFTSSGEGSVNKILEEYYFRNKGKAKTQENNQIALTEVQNNAKELLNMYAVYKKVQERVNNLDKDKEQKIDGAVKGNLLRRLSFDEFGKSKFAQAEQEINAGKESKGVPKVGERPIKETFGNKESIQKQISSSKITEATIQKAIEERQKFKEETKAKLEKLTEEAEAESSTETKAKEALKEFQKELKITNVEIPILQRAAEQIKTQREEWEKIVESDEEFGVLTEDEILALDAVSRARMLDDNNLENYSLEQQARIKNLKRNLNKRNSTLLKKIADQAVLAKYLRANEEASNLMLDNPDEAGFVLERERFAQEAMIKDYENFNIANLVESRLQTTEGLIEINAFSESTAEDFLSKFFAVINPNVLNWMFDNMESFPTLSKYADLLTRMKEFKEYSYALKKGISSIVAPADTRTNQFFQKAFEEKFTTEAFKKYLEDSLNNTKLLKRTREQIQEVLDYIKSIEKLREAGKSLKESDDELSDTRKTLEEKRNERQKAIEEDIKARAERKKKKEQEKKDKEEKEEKEEEEEQETNKAKEEKEEEKIDEEGKETDKEEEEEKQEKKEEQEEKEGFSNEANSLIDTPSYQSGLETETLIGNTFYYYDGKILSEGFERERKGKEGGTLDKVLQWLDKNNIKLQEIIDYELADIKKLNPDIKIMVSNPTFHKEVERVCFLVVEYNESLQKEVTHFGIKKTKEKIHKDDRGGVISTEDGKQYLIIGTLGYVNNENANSQQQKEYFTDLQTKITSAKNKYFKKYSDRQYFIMPEMHTKIVHIGSGRIVNGTTKDTQKVFRTLKELFDHGDPEKGTPDRNPHDLNYENVVFGIQTSDGFKLSKDIGDDIYVVPFLSTEEGSAESGESGQFANQGRVYLMIKNAQGIYIPTLLKSTTVQDLKEGDFRNAIIDNIRKLFSEEESIRSEGWIALNNMLALSKTGKNISVYSSKSKKKFVAFKQGNKIITGCYFDSVLLNSEQANGYNITRVIDTFFEIFNPRIKLTNDILANPLRLQELDEAGAIQTDIGKLGCDNADFVVAKMDENGNPITITKEEIKRPYSRKNTERTKDRVYPDRIYYPNDMGVNILYTFENDSWHRIVSNSEQGVLPEVLDPNNDRDKLIIKKLNTIRQIRMEKLSPLISIPQAKGGKIQIYKLAKNLTESILVFSYQNGRIVIKEDAADVASIEETLKPLIEEKRKEEQAAKELKELNKDELNLEDIEKEQRIKEQLEKEQEQLQQQQQQEETKPQEPSKERKPRRPGILGRKTAKPSVTNSLFKKATTDTVIKTLLEQKGCNYTTEESFIHFCEEKKLPTTITTEEEWKTWCDTLKNCII